MRMPRFRIWMLMAVVVLAALFLAGIIGYQRFWEPRVEVFGQGIGSFTIQITTVTDGAISPWVVVLAVAILFLVLGWAWRKHK